MTTEPMTVTADLSAVEAMLAELSALAPELSPQVRGRLVDLGERFSELFDIVSGVDVAATTNTLLVTAKPTDRLAAFMSAVRAGNLDLALIEKTFNHGDASSAKPDATTVSKRRDRS